MNRIPLPPAFLRPGLLAHRGLHSDGVPENSLAAFEAAVRRGYGVELDVQRSADDVAMAFHDDTLERLTELEGPITAKPAAELAATPLRDGGGAGVPTLVEALEVIDGKVPLLIEIKDQDGQMGEDVGPLEEAVADALWDYNGPVAVMSFNPHSVAQMAELAPQISRGLVTSRFEAEHWPELHPHVRDTLREIPDVARVGAAFVSHQGDALDMPRITELRAAGLPILCWTIRSPADEAKAREVARAVTFEGYLP